MKIDPDRLRSLRKKKSLTRPALAKRSGISERTIQRLENEPNQSNKTQEHTLNELARALGVEQGVLTGEVPLPEYKNTPPSDPERVQIGAQVAPKTRLAYDLIKRRYGVSATEIINMAPLFFALLAEGSLAWRREEVKVGEGHLQQIDSGHGVFGDVMVVADMAMGQEMDSISEADLFGKHLEDQIGGPVFDPSKNNPFASYLRKLTKDLESPGIVDVEDGDLNSGLSLKFPYYEICRDEVDGLANGSAIARWALEMGGTRLSEIPNELMEEDVGEERAGWLEGKLRGIYKEILKTEGGDKVVGFVTKDHSGEIKDFLEEKDSEKTDSVDEEGDNQ